MSAVSALRSGETDYSMEKLYSVVGKSRQNYAKAIKRKQQIDDVEHQTLEQVRVWRMRHPKMGSRSLYYSMVNQGVELSIGVTKFEQLISKHKMTVGVAKKSGPYTSDGLGRRSYPNLTNGLIINGINQLLVADITYIWVSNRWCYLFLLKDVYSQRLISIIPSENMKAENAVKTLLEFKELRGVDIPWNCIHHSDNGSQYEAITYRSILDKWKMQISRAKTCKQNGSIEQMNHIVKNMYLNNYGIQTYKQLQSACKEVKYLMNNERAIKVLGHHTSVSYENGLKKIPFNRRAEKTMYDFIDT